MINKFKCSLPLHLHILIVNIEKQIMYKKIAPKMFLHNISSPNNITIASPK